MKISQQLAKSATSSSRRWLARQFDDPYIQQRFQSPDNYRSRSAFKLIELDARFNLFERPDVNVVVDLGAAPGGWSQVVSKKFGYQDELKEAKAASLVRKIRAGSGFGLPEDKKLEIEGTWSSGVDKLEDGRHLGAKKIIAIDLLRMRPVPGVSTLQMDFLDPEASKYIAALLPLHQKKVDIILSDMAANISGNSIRDSENHLTIYRAVLDFAKTYLQQAEVRPRAGVLLLASFFEYM